MALKVLQVHNIANVPSAISRGLNRIGVPSELLEYRDPYEFGGAEYSLELEKKNVFQQGAARLKTFLWATRNFDVIHMHSAALLPLYLDAPLARVIPSAKAKLVYSHWGADLRGKRVPFFSTLNCSKRFVAPDLYEFAPGVEALPVCIDLEYWKPEKAAGNRKKGGVVVMHAPTNRAFKNTEAVLRAVESLKRDGLEFDFRLVEGVSLAELREELRSCDILLDQFNSWYATLACEAMALQKPVLATLRPDILRRFAPDCPIVNVRPDKIAGAVRELVEDAGLRKRKGREGLAFVRKRHDCVVVARRLKKVYEEITA
ncbi:hypothetical protein COU38_01940 [Candidatus Micrarchaeota archaeon CG10_big_fil_rev_8_21_14_0_10_54_18]|nr:MAG: hypothetical protein COU38_01940 [Candidatus Micrarchaeota archaeon CG10_big_fil_rev_8_21_14_0_10_54_18]